MKRIAILIAVVAAVIGGVYWARGSGGEEKAPTFETVRVDRGRVVAKVTATGTLSALVTVQVGSQVSGRIQEIHVDFNSPVKKGQVIARIDPRLFEAAVEQARANVIAAQSQFTKAKVNAAEAERALARMKTLYERKLVAQAEVESAQAAVESGAAEMAAARGEIARAKASLNQAEINLAYTTIVSPTDGTVISRSVDVGQTVAASLQAPTLFTIAEDLTQMQVDTSVAEADVGKLQAGMEATFTVDAFPGERFHGEIRQIRNAPQTVQNVVTYNAVVNVANPELKLRPGMTASVTFVHAEREDVLRLPNAALRFRPSREVLQAAGVAMGGEGGRRGTRGGGGSRSHAPESRGGAPSGSLAAAASPRGVGGRIEPAREKGAEAEATGTGTGSGGSGAGSEGRAVHREGTSGAGGSDSGAMDLRRLWVLRGGKPAPVDVRLGVSDGSHTELVDGPLKEGDEVISEAAGGAGSERRGGPGFRRIL